MTENVQKLCPTLAKKFDVCSFSMAQCVLYSYIKLLFCISLYLYTVNKIYNTILALVHATISCNC